MPFRHRAPLEVIAHRGFSARAPENTLVALRMALEAGADAVEFDLHTAGDGTPVLLHDATLQRTTTGTGAVTDHPLAHLRSLDAGSWFGPDFEGEPLPTLAEALAAVSESGARVYAELKSVRRHADVEIVTDVVREAGMVERVVLISMRWDLLEAYRGRLDGALVGLIVEHPVRVGPALARAADDPRVLVDFDARILLSDPKIAVRAEAASIPLAVWTVDDPEVATRLVEMEVRRITTNEVARLVELRDSLGVDGRPDKEEDR